MKHQDFKQLLDKYTKGECSPEEAAFVEEWYDNMGKSGNTGSVNFEETQAQLWNKISPPKQRAGRSVGLFTVVKIAAGLVLVTLAAWLLMPASPVEQVATTIDAPTTPATSSLKVVANNTGKPMSVSLNDGSQIILQTRSEISFEENLSGARREVFLRGEAFFDVARDEQRPFLVYSNELVTKVLGTSFNIKAYDTDKEITVAVKSGKVSVYHTPEGEGQSNSEAGAVILKPNQQAVYDKTRESVIKQLVEKPEIVKPDSKLFTMSFEERPVSEIFDLLEEHYGVDIVYDDKLLKRCTLTTAMSEEGLYQRIEVICKAIKAEYSIAEGMIFIESTGCK